MMDEFYDITGFNISAFFDRFTGFVSNESQKIIDYYSGVASDMDRDAYNNYQKLVVDVKFVLDLFYLNMNRFKTTDYWNLIEFCDDISIKLETIGNFSKYARSSVDKESFTSDVVVQLAMKENETVEEMIARLGSNDRDQDWVDVALSNALIQEDYDTRGGKVLNITFKNNSNYFINGIVDNPEGDRVKGRDVCKKLTFENEDIKVLGYDDTLLQTLDILINLRKNDNPEFPELGVDKTLVTGVSFKSIMLPAFIRQLFDTFATDDLISGVEITNTDFDEDNFNAYLNINIKSGEEQQRTLSL
jgi:hypothetical protein